MIFRWPPGGKIIIWSGMDNSAGEVSSASISGNIPCFAETVPKGE
jgi:hypothetical protein